MPSTIQAALSSWSFPPWLTALNLFGATLYIRGWSALRSIRRHFTPARLASFLSGIAILQIALASPIDAFDPFFLTDHMLQHMLLMMVVPPLILLGDPVIPLLHGLPRWAAHGILGPLLRARSMRAIGRLLIYPPLTLLLMSVVMIGWHLPRPYELALRWPGWHEVEHASFLISSFLFWSPVVQPWPGKFRWNRWALPIYLLLADFVNSALSAFLTFSDRVFYPSYELMPRLGGISAHNDQVAAGAMMWVIGSFAFLIPAVLITVRMLSPVPSEIPRNSPVIPARSPAQPVTLAALCVILPFAALGYGLLAPDKIDIDGDVVRMQGDSGPFRVSVFTPPDVLLKDGLDLAVLIQDRDTGDPILDGAVDVQIRSTQGGEATMVEAHPSRDQASNRLLAAAPIDLPHAGSWDLRVSVRRRNEAGSISCQVDVADLVSQ